MLWGALWGGLEELWESVCGRGVPCVKVVWGALGNTLGGSGGALGEFWEALYIKKLPINRPCGRYVIPALQTNVVGGEGSQDSLDGARNRCSKKG